MRDVVKTNVKRQQSSKRQHRRRRYRALYFMLVLILVVGVGVSLSMTLFFNITTITVVNETDYPEDTIVATSGIRYGDNLVRLDTAIAERRIRAAMVYVEDVRIQRDFPTGVKITLAKSVPIANIAYNYGYLLVSASGKILETVAEPRSELLCIAGYSPVTDVAGQILASNENGKDKVLRTVTEAVAECQDAGIVSVDLKDQYAILVQFGENITFEMGNSNEAVYKLRLATKTIAALNPEKRYRLTMVGNNQISVIPEGTVGAGVETTPENTTEPPETTTHTP